jgi:hypothetical protein
MHISEFFDFEQEDMGGPEKEDELDEALQEKTTAEAGAPETAGAVSTHRGTRLTANSTARIAK